MHIIEEEKYWRYFFKGYLLLSEKLLQIPLFFQALLWFELVWPDLLVLAFNVYN